MPTVVTDGLRGLGIDGRGILSLFHDILPIATLLTQVTYCPHERRGEQRVGRREENDTLLYSF